MFNKKSCHNCGEKISDKFDFCPSCGTSIMENKKKEDMGMLGKKDSKDPFEEGMLGGLSGKMLNKMIGSAMKMIEKEMRKNMNNNPPQQNQNMNNNFELFVNGKKINPNRIKVVKRPAGQKQNHQYAKKKNNNNKKPQDYRAEFTKESQEKYTTLDKVEPKTNIRRFSNKVIYEIEIPEVKSLKDISVVRLENSIEVKAIGETKAYKKLIPIDLPLRKYKFDKEKLILELSVKD